MLLIYNFFLGIYAVLAYVAAPFNTKIRKFILGRSGIFKMLKGKIKAGDKIIWFHAASLGEFEQGRPVIEALKLKRPDYKILVTFFSPSGYEIRKNYAGADIICYLPIDFSWHAKRFVDIVKPSAVYFIKYEFWHNYIHEVSKRNIPLYCISGIFREEQMFFKWYGGWFRNTLRKFFHFYVQNNVSRELLQRINIQCVEVSGDTRFDRVFDIAKSVKELPIVTSFAANYKTLIAGSTWPADEDLLIQFINSTSFDCKFIIAPHEIHESGIQRIISLLKVEAVRYSQAANKDISQYKVLVIDNIGMLSSIYQYGIISYIGGGFGKGIHNTLEAATFGLPVIFGPKYLKFKEAVDLVEKQGAFNIEKYEDLRSVLDALLGDDKKRSNASTTCKEYVTTNVGATERILKNVVY